MNARTLLVLVSVLSLGTGGCRILKSLTGDKEEPSATPVAPPVPSVVAAPVPTPPPQPVAYTAAPAPTPDPAALAAAAAAADQAIPTTVDFEEEAIQLMTKDALKVRVADLSREIKGK